MSSTCSKSHHCTAAPVSFLCSVFTFLSIFAFVSQHIQFRQNLTHVITLQRNELIHMVLSIEGISEVATESCPEWDLKPPPLNFVYTIYVIELLGHEFNSLSEPNLYCYSNFISLFSVHVSLRSLPK